ncbi:DMT family transporter [Candidatus Woesearchaeota archaeon]|nr:DMT family transporter [Candidatus Woesearchaeota archaeon]
MKLNPYLEVIIAATFGGLGGALIKLINLPPTSVTFFRFIVPVVLLYIFLKFRKIELFRGNYKVMLGASLINAIRILFFSIGYIYTTMGNAIIMFFTWPIFAALLSIILLKEKVNAKTLALFAMAFVGLIVMYINKEINFSNNDFIGMTAMLFSGIGYALTIIIFKKELPNYTKTETIFYQNLLGAIIFLPFIFINKPYPTMPQLGLGIIYPIIAGLCTFYFFFSALKKLKVAHYSLLTYWEVIAAIFFGVLIFGEAVTWNMVVGGGLIIASSILLRMHEKQASA